MRALAAAAKWSAGVLTGALLLCTDAHADVGAAVTRGRAAIEAGDCHGAVKILQDAVPEAAAFPVQEERYAAISAIHFYTALAFSNCGEAEKAREQLREFVRFRKGTSTIDPTLYPPRFVAMFEQAQRQPKATEMFDEFYPGFNAYADPVEKRVPLQIWATSPEFQILAENDEKDRWDIARDDQARAEVIRRFWDRRDADKDPAKNEFREQVVRRVAFADRAFADPQQERGAFSDRGRVFILLGPPALIRRQGLQRFQTSTGRRGRTPLTGSLERWIYFRPQLPAAIPDGQVEFLFVTQPGEGEAVMQKEFMSLKALSEARKAYARGQARAE